MIHFLKSVVSYIGYFLYTHFSDDCNVLEDSSFDCFGCCVNTCSRVCRQCDYCDVCECRAMIISDYIESFNSSLKGE